MEPVIDFVQRQLLLHLGQGLEKVRVQRVRLEVLHIIKDTVTDERLRFGKEQLGVGLWQEAAREAALSAMLPI